LSPCSKDVLPAVIDRLLTPTAVRRTAQGWVVTSRRPWEDGAGCLPDASRAIVGTGAGFDLLSVDEALDLADDVGAARIIAHTD